MNDNLQKTYEQYFCRMEEMQKCGDIKSAIRFCDRLMSCANEMPSPEKENILTYGFIIRGQLNYMCANYERAYKDATRAIKLNPPIKHNPRNSHALHLRACIALVKGPFLQKGFPDHHVISQGWADISNIEGVENDTGHFAHADMQMWRQKLSQWGFFPAITDIDLWGDFCKKFPMLYHVVPEKYEHTFSREGLIILRTLTNLRSEEDWTEGLSHVAIHKNGAIHIQGNEAEVCVFCLSQTKDIAKIRKGGVLYEIETKYFIRNLDHALSCRKRLRIPKLRYFADLRPYENEGFFISMSAGSVFYGEQVSYYSSPFVKLKKRWSKEQEVRIGMNLFSDDSSLIDSMAEKHQSLTLEDGEPGIYIEVPNPSEWQHKIQST